MKYQFSLRDLRNLEFNYSKSNRMEEYLKLKLFGKSAMDILTPVYLLAVRFSPRLLKEYNLDLALIRREPKREKCSEMDHFLSGNWKKYDSRYLKYWNYYMDWVTKLISRSG